MNEQVTPAMQQQVQALYRYTEALERGDLEMLTSVLALAAENPALERMLLEVNDAYMAQNETSTRPIDVVQAQLALASIPVEHRDVEPETGLVHSGVANKASDNHAAPSQVLPAKMLHSHLWYQRPRYWVTAVAAAVLIALLVIPGTGGFADQFLSIFHVQQFQPVQINPADFLNRPLPGLQDFGDVAFQPGSFNFERGLSVAQITQQTSFHIMIPSKLPSGVSGAPGFDGLSRGQGMFTFSATKVRAYLTSIGHADFPIPANLDGATFNISVSTGVLIHYANRAGIPFVLIELPSPIVRATGKATLEQLRDFMLSLPNLPQQLVLQLRQINLNSGTVPIPVPPDVSSHPVPVQGTTGLILTSVGSSSVMKLPLGNLLLWQTNGIIYAEGGSDISAAQLTSTANSLH